MVINRPLSAPVWHYAITRALAQQLESIQKRAIHIIFPFTQWLCYSYVIFAAKLTSSGIFPGYLWPILFHSPSSSSPCNTSLLSRLRAAATFPCLISRMNKHCSFITDGLNHYQTKILTTRDFSCILVTPFYIWHSIKACSYRFMYILHCFLLYCNSISTIWLQGRMCELNMCICICNHSSYSVYHCFSDIYISQGTVV